MAETLERPNKPEELTLLDDLLGLGIPFVDGGYVNQPWILIQQLAVAAQARETVSASRKMVTPSDE